MMEMSGTVKISGELLPWIDGAIEQVRDEFGGQKYRTKKDVVDDAVKRLLKELGVKPIEKEAA